jgi:hypothetical protein
VCCVGAAVVGGYCVLWGSGCLCLKGRTVCDPRLVHVGFVVDNVTLGRVSFLFPSHSVSPVHIVPSVLRAP